MNPLVTETATTAYSPTVDTVLLPYVGNTPDAVSDAEVANDMTKPGRISLLVRRRRRKNRISAR